MIIGVGTDICDIKRIAQLIERFNTRFLTKVFTDYEQLYCDHQAAQAACYAKRFAAKEAVAKALAGAQTTSLSWQEVEVRNAPSGQPYIELYGQARQRFEQAVSQGYHPSLHISLSDEPPYALAFAILSAARRQA